MKTRELTRVIFGLMLVVALFASLTMVFNAKAQVVTYMSFNDSVWSSLAVSGPDTVSPGDSVVYTVTGILAVNMTGSVHINIWLNSASQTQEVLVSQYVLTTATWVAGSAINAAYTAIIPGDAANNKYVYATLDAGPNHFSVFAVEPKLRARNSVIQSNQNC